MSAFRTRALSVWHRSGARLDDAVSDQACISASALTAPGSIGVALGTNGSEPHARRIITSGYTVSSSKRPSLVISKISSSSDRSPLIFRFLWSNRPHSSARPPLPRKENPRSRAPNCSGEGGRSTTHFCLYNIYSHNHLSIRRTPVSQLGTYSQTPYSLLYIYTESNTHIYIKDHYQQFHACSAQKPSQN